MITSLFCYSSESFLHVWEWGNNLKTIIEYVWQWMVREIKSGQNLQGAFVAIVWSAYYGELFMDGVTPCPLCWSDATGSQSAVSCNAVKGCRIQWEDSEQHRNLPSIRRIKRKSLFIFFLHQRLFLSLWWTNRRFHQCQGMVSMLTFCRRPVSIQFYTATCSTHFCHWGGYTTL